MGRKENQKRATQAPQPVQQGSPAVLLRRPAPSTPVTGSPTSKNGSNLASPVTPLSNTNKNNSNNNNNNNKNGIEQASTSDVVVIIPPRLTEIRTEFAELLRQQQTNTISITTKSLGAPFFKTFIELALDVVRLILENPKQAVEQSWVDLELWRPLHQLVKLEEKKFDSWRSKNCNAQQSPVSKDEPVSNWLWFDSAVVEQVTIQWDSLQLLYESTLSLLEKCAHTLSPKSNSSIGRKLLYPVLTHIGDVQRYLAKAAAKTLACLCGEKVNLHALDELAKQIPGQHFSLRTSLFRSVKMYKAAVGSYQAVIAIHPRKGTAWNQLALCYEERQDFFYAAYAYVRAITAPERFPLASENLSKLLGKKMRQGDDPMSRFETIALEVLALFESTRKELALQRHNNDPSASQIFSKFEERCQSLSEAIASVLELFLQKPSWFLPNRMLERFTVVLSLYAPLFLDAGSSFANDSTMAVRQGALLFVQSWLQALCDGVCQPDTDHTRDVRESMAVALELALRMYPHTVLEGVNCATLGCVLRFAPWLLQHNETNNPTDDECYQVVLAEDREVEGLSGNTTSRHNNINGRAVEVGEDTVPTTASKATAITIDEFHRGDKGSIASSESTSAIRRARLRLQLQRVLFLLEPSNASPSASNNNSSVDVSSFQAPIGQPVAFDSALRNVWTTNTLYSPWDHHAAQTSAATAHSLATKGSSVGAVSLATGTATELTAAGATPSVAEEMALRLIDDDDDSDDDDIIVYQHSAFEGLQSPLTVNPPPRDALPNYYAQAAVTVGGERPTTSSLPPCWN